MERKQTVVTGTIGMDAHVIGTKMLSRVLREHGFKVVELGCLTPPDDFIKAAQETNADAILMTSLYGMAEIDLAEFKAKCVESGLANLLLYIGGNLAASREESENFPAIRAKFEKLGFNRVYPPDVDLEGAITELRKDIEKKESAATT
jgi:methylaspartate mutase S subunit